MTKDEIMFLFDKHLKRQPNEEEYRFHIGKSYEKFEDELEYCQEKNRINKIAILISGHIRNGAILQSLEKIKQKYDVFVFAWDNIGYRNDFTNIDIFKEEINNLIKNIPNLKNYEIGNNIDYVRSVVDQTLAKTYFNYSSPESYIKSQLFSVYKVYELFENYCKKNKETYDIVFKFRFDATIEKFNITTKTINYIKNNTVFVTNNGCHVHPFFGNGCFICDTMFDNKIIGKNVDEHSNNICDFFAYGNEKSMKTYCSMVQNYDILNHQFNETNFKTLKERPESFTKAGNNYNIKHPDCILLYKCSYPERILQHLLKDCSVVTSRDVITSWDTSHKNPLR